ncbi:Endonuclease V [Symmachiella macrocystis]|uniref:Endonuclease V n=1 Tax=Symmachiella macrocystis TaxID=2527985 RepID=A0A5C6BPH3_9PLAN|nr:endonuclease V [Symmachiella macrocystis]TWU12909.1 Endonuclease V [Symmachiella macrocystis]
MDIDVEIPDLPAALRDLIAQIPPGRVTTYGALAAALGSDSATRWVGSYVLDPLVAAALPVHRIVLAAGELGLYYTGDAADKCLRLQSEGIEVEKDRIELPRWFFDGFQSSQPLRTLSALQEDYTKRLQLTRPAARPQTVGGVDLSYITDGRAVAGYALIDVATRKLLWSTTLTAEVAFPYIPTFLSFRELPLLLRLLDQVRREDRMPDLVFVDGNGVMHDRRMGIACMLGIAADVATVGISKKLLCGQVETDDMAHREARPVVDGEEVLGMALKSRNSSKLIYVSPGHRIDFATALEVTQSLLAGHRLPEPTHWADKLSRDEVRRISAAQS